MLGFILIGAMGLLSGCGTMKPEEAQAYTQATLDAVYCGELDAYVRLVDITKEEAQEWYDESIQLTLETMGLEEFNVSEEVKAQYKDVVIALAKAAKYEVGEATENEQDGFDVEVIVQPVQGFETLEDDLTDALMKEFKKMDELPNDEEINNLTYMKMAELMINSLEDPMYGDEMTVMIRVIPDENDVYHIPNEDLEKIDSALFSM